MNQLSEKYLANLKRYNQLENTFVDPDCTEQELLSILSDMANEKRLIQKEQDGLLEEYLSPYESGQKPVTPAVAADLGDFSKQLNQTFGGIDSAITYRIHQILLEYAKSLSDYDGIAEQLYGCGMDEYYFNLQSPGEYKCPHFADIWYYEDHYKDLSGTGRNFYERCLTNDIVNFSNQDPDRLFAEGERILRAYDQIEDMYGSLVSDAKKLRSSIYVNILTAASSFREGIGETPENTRKLYHYAKIAYGELLAGENTELSSAAHHPGYYYAYFHAGKIDLETMLQKLEPIMQPAPELSRYANCLRVYSNTAGYISYLLLYSKKPAEEIQKIARQKVRSVMKYTRLLRLDGDSPVVNRFLASFILSTFEVLPQEQAIRTMLQVTIAQHKPTCIHTIVVSRLCEQILNLVLKYCPEKLAGTAGYSAEEIHLHKKELRRLIQCGAVLHDVGKYYCFNVISNASRRLEEIEYKKIKLHPAMGCSLLQRTNFSQPILDCILRHHVWHNGKGGYPQGLSSTENQPLVDILSIADSLDAATDWFGRSYARPKSVPDLIEEFDSQRDTRYAGFVIDVLRRPEGIRQIEQILDEQRREITCEVWQDKDGHIVSKMVSRRLFHEPL